MDTDKSSPSQVIRSEFKTKKNDNKSSKSGEQYDNNNKLTIAQLLGDFYGVFIGHGIALNSMCHYPDAYAPLIFVGVGLVILELLGLASGLRNWRLLNTRVKHLVFRMIVFIMINILLINFFILTVENPRHSRHLDAFRNVVISNSIIFYLYSTILFIIQIVKYCLHLKMVKANNKLPVSSAIDQKAEIEEDKEDHENGDI